MVLIVGLLLVIVTMSLYARNSTPFHPYDEWQHLDYALKAGNLDLPADNELLGQTTLRELACRGIEAPGWRLDGENGLPPCDSAEFDPSSMPESGYNTAAQAIPGYYFPTGVLSRVISDVTPVSSPLLAVRIVSAMWLGAGLFVFYLLGREFDATRSALAIVGLLLAASPVIITASSHANPDSMLLLSGGLIMLTVVRWTKGEIGLWAPAVVSAVAITIDRVTVLALAIGVVYAAAPLFAGAKPTRPRMPRRGQPVDAPTATLVVIALLVMMLALERILPVIRELLVGSSGQLTVDLARYDSQQRPPFSRDVFLGSFTNMVSPLNYTDLPDISGDLTYSSLRAVVNWLIIGGALGTAAWAPAGSPQRRLGAAAASVMLLAAPLVSGAMWLSGGLFFALPPRYGLAMVPALGVTLALSLRGKLITSIVAAIAVSQFILFGYRTLALG